MILLFLIFLGEGGTPRNDDLTAAYAGVQIVYDAIVRADGSVDYQTLDRRPDLRGHLLKFERMVETIDPAKIENPRQRLAFLANTYNVLTLNGVLRSWPTTSVKKIAPLFGFFTRKSHIVGGRKVSLNRIEKEWLRPLDPRIHFIINCASRSCPSIPKTVLTADNVEEIMDDSARRFLADGDKNQFDRTANEWRLSKIFEWYAEDFGGEAGLIDFITKFGGDRAAWKPAKISYLDYDWDLNGPTE